MLRLSMRVVTFGLLAVMAMGLLAGCYFPGGFHALRGSGNLETREFEFSDFTEVEAQSAFRVTLVPGDEFAVEVTTDDNLWDVTDIRQVGERVILGHTGAFSLSSGTMEATVTLPVLEELHLSGAAAGRFEGFASEESLYLDLSGASRAEGEIEAGDTTIDLSGASKLVLVGSGDNLRLDVSGASNAEVDEYAVADADVSVSGASRAVVDVAGTLDADASGASHVIYVGSPTMGVIDTSGASSVEQR